MWTENFQMYKLGLEKAEEPEVKLPTHAIIEKAREFQKNIYICFIDYAKALHCVDHKKTEETSQRHVNTRPLYLSSEKLICTPRSNS